MRSFDSRALSLRGFAPSQLRRHPAHLSDGIHILEAEDIGPRAELIHAAAIRAAADGVDVDGARYRVTFVRCQVVGNLSVRITALTAVRADDRLRVHGRSRRRYRVDAEPCLLRARERLR